MNADADKGGLRGPSGLAGVFFAYKWSILFVTVAVVAVGLYLSSRQQPIYESQARVLVLPIIPAGGPEGQLADINLATERELALSESVGTIAADNLTSDEPLRDLMSGLTVDSPVETEIIFFNYRNGDPETARDRAQAFAAAYLEYRRSTAKAKISSSAERIQAELEVLNTRLAEINAQIQQADPAGQAALQGSANFVLELILERQLAQLGTSDEGNVGQLFQDASLPSSPVSPDPVRNGGLSFVLGLILGVSQALARSTLKTAKPAVAELKEETMLPEPLKAPETYTTASPTVKKMAPTDGMPARQSERATHDPVEPQQRSDAPSRRSEALRRDPAPPRRVEASGPSANEVSPIQRYPVPRERKVPPQDSTESGGEGHVRKTKSPYRSEEHGRTVSPNDRRIREELFWASPAEQEAAKEDLEDNPADPRD